MMSLSNPQRIRNRHLMRDRIMISSSEWTWAEDGAIVWETPDPKAAFRAAVRLADSVTFVWSDDDVMVAL